MNQIILAKECESDSLFEKIFNKYGIRIPDDVVAFLKKNSRGLLKDEPEIKEIESIVSNFVSINEKDRFNIFSFMKQINDDDEKKLFVPIAEDGFGNCYCLTYKEHNFIGICYLANYGDTEKLLCSDFAMFLDILDLK